MAGARFVEDVVAGGGQMFDITVFGDEPHGNYNRILLSGVLAGSHRSDDIILNPLSWYAANGVGFTPAFGSNGRSRRPAGRRRTTASRTVRRLVIATGSRPLLPPIEGLVSDDGALRDGVFVFRTIEDCERIARARDARAAVVIGGGLLGIEAARGLAQPRLDVHIVHLTAHVMDAQLDRRRPHPAAPARAMGLQILTPVRTTAVLGRGASPAFCFADGSTSPATWSSWPPASVRTSSWPGRPACR